MGVAPGLWVKAEIVGGESVGGESVGLCLLPEPANDSSSCQRLCVERGCGIKALDELFVSQSDHWVDAQGAARGNVRRKQTNEKHKRRYPAECYGVGRRDTEKKTRQQAG